MWGSRLCSTCKSNALLFLTIRSSIPREQAISNYKYNNKSNVVCNTKKRFDFLKKLDKTRNSNKTGKISLNSLLIFAAVVASNENEHENKDITDLLKKGQKMMHEKCNPDKVEDVYIEALHLALEKKDKNMIAIVQDQLANLALKRNHLKKAEELFKNVMRNLLDSGKKENNPAILEISLKLTMIYAALGNSEHAVRGYQWIIESCRSNLKDLEKIKSKDKSITKEYNNLQALMGMTLDSYGRFLFVHGKHKEALKITQEAADICVEIFGEEDSRTLVLYNDIGTILHQLGNADEAIKMIEKAIDISSRNKDTRNHSDMAVFWVNLANIYSQQGKGEKANTAFDAALKEANASKDEILVERIVNFMKNSKSSPDS